jgi:hypothetical protein
MAHLADGKPNQAHITEDVEHGSREEKISDVESSVLEYDQQDTRKILWKIDIRLVPFLALLYLYVMCFHKSSL